MHHIDFDNDGFIDRDELRNGLMSLLDMTSDHNDSFMEGMEATEREELESLERARDLKQLEVVMQVSKRENLAQKQRQQHDYMLQVLVPLMKMKYESKYTNSNNGSSNENNENKEIKDDEDNDKDEDDTVTNTSTATTSTASVQKQEKQLQVPSTTSSTGKAAGELIERALTRLLFKELTGKLQCKTIVNNSTSSDDIVLCITNLLNDEGDIEGYETDKTSFEQFKLHGRIAIELEHYTNDGDEDEDGDDAKTEYSNDDSDSDDDENEDSEESSSTPSSKAKELVNNQQQEQTQHKQRHRLVVTIVLNSTSNAVYIGKFNVETGTLSGKVLQQKHKEHQNKDQVGIGNETYALEHEYTFTVRL